MHYVLEIMVYLIILIEECLRKHIDDGVTNSYFFIVMNLLNFYYLNMNNLICLTVMTLFIYFLTLSKFIKLNNRFNMYFNQLALGARCSN